MKKKWLKSNGFTLAELLIVVAIIAVLVAISIPIFTTQLEKAREATDLSDVRSAYAEVMMAAITDDTTATYSKDSTQTIHKSNGLYSVDVYPLHQEKNDWQGTIDLNVGGVSSSDSTHWIGTPQAKGSCEVSYNPQGDAVTFNWLGKSNAGSGTDTGNVGNNNSGNGSSTGGGSTPAPTPNPGNDGGTTGGDNNQENTGTGDNTGGSDNNHGNTGTGGIETPPTEPGDNTPDTKPTESTDKTPETEKSAYKTLEDLADTYPTEDRNYKRGSLYFYHNKLFVCKTPPSYEGEYSYNEWYKNEPDGNRKAQFPEITEDALQNCLYYSDLVSKNDGTFAFTNIKYGNIYKDPYGNYFIFVGGSQYEPTQASPPDGTAYTNIDSNWVPILPDTHKRS